MKTSPTAQQSEALTQLTPKRSLSWVALVLALDTIDQLVPFHCSARVWPAAAVAGDSHGPAVRAADTADAFEGLLPWVVLGLGRDLTAQPVPFHCSARVCSVVPLMALPNGPAVRGADAADAFEVIALGGTGAGAGHDRPAGAVPLLYQGLGHGAVPGESHGPAGRGADAADAIEVVGSGWRWCSGWAPIDQPVPFHCSVRVWKVVPLVAVPTAQQSEALTQLTPSRSVVLGGAGVRTGHDRPAGAVPLLYQGLGRWRWCRGTSHSPSSPRR